jgi:transcriptional regulator with XRE-family HTH domain
MSELTVLTNIGKNIRSIRTKKGMTQFELSKKCNIEKAGLSKIESGLSNPTVRTLFKISQSLDVEVIELFSE